MKKLKFNLRNYLLLILLIASDNSFAAPNYNAEAERLNNKITDEVFKNYLKTAKNLSQKPNPFLKDNQFSEANKQAFDNAFSEKQLKQIFPKLDVEGIKAKAPGLNQLMIFVSSSMPNLSLKQYAIDVRKTGGVLVLRGLINNSFKETIAFIKALNDQGTTAIIDPLAFQNFDIKQVPQIVVIIDNHGCQFGRCDHTPLFDKISGNVTLEYALNAISKRGEFAKKEAARFLTYLRGKNG